MISINAESQTKKKSLTLKSSFRYFSTLYVENQATRIPKKQNAG